jgi:hypothetical protein
VSRRRVCQRQGDLDAKAAERRWIERETVAKSLRPRPAGPKGWVKGLQGPGIAVIDPNAPRP